MAVPQPLGDLLGGASGRFFQGLHSEISSSIVRLALLVKAIELISILKQGTNRSATMALAAPPQLFHRSVKKDNGLPR